MNKGVGFFTGRALSHIGPVAGRIGSSFGVGLAAFAGETAATLLAQQFGFEDKRFEAGAGFAGAVGAGALAGAAFGPIGAGLGAGVAAAGVGVSKLTSALFNSGWGKSGPVDNWFFYETKDASNMCFGTYCSGDNWYTHTYDKRSPGSNSSGDFFSAGQA
jgi:hypothetical protein